MDINSSDSDVGTSNNPSSDSEGGNLSYSNDGSVAFSINGSKLFTDNVSFSR